MPIFYRDVHAHRGALFRDGVHSPDDAPFRHDVPFHDGVPSHWHVRDLRGVPCADGVPDGRGALDVGDALCVHGAHRADGFPFLNFQCS